MEADDEAELDARQQDGIEFHRQLLAPMLAAVSARRSGFRASIAGSNLALTLREMKEAGKSSRDTKGPSRSWSTVRFDSGSSIAKGAPIRGAHVVTLVSCR